MRIATFFAFFGIDPLILATRAYMRIATSTSCRYMQPCFPGNPRLHAYCNAQGTSNSCSIRSGNPHSHAYCNYTDKQLHYIASLATRTHMRIATGRRHIPLVLIVLATRTHMRIATAKMHNTTTRRVRKCRAFRTWIPSLTRFEKIKASEH